LGALAIQYAEKLGLKPIAIDIDNARLTDALNLGAVAAFNTRDPEFSNEIRKVTGGGLPAVCVFSGVTAAYASAVQCLAIGGLLMAVGMVSISSHSTTITSSCSQLNSK